MPRYIDADLLKELIDGGFDIDFDEVPETKKALLHMIDYQETADVVEVVRCKECSYHELDGDGDDWCVWSGNNIKPTDFCSKGERREDGA